jgi:hypothetical protein
MSRLIVVSGQKPEEKGRASMFIRFKKSIFHEGQPIQVGARMELPDGEAKHYIRMKVADQVDPPKRTKPKKKTPRASSSPAKSRETRRAK